MLRTVRLAIAATLVAASPLLGQAPRITPQGDPSVRNDTIYRLAVDPADHPDEGAIWIFDDGVLRLEADGRGTKTYRSVVQILTQAAAEGYHEHSFSFDPARQNLTINWMRVVRPDGTVISAEPTITQEADVPASMVNPIYSSRRVIRASLSGVAPGTLVDYSYTTEELDPHHPGDFFLGWSVTTGLLVRRSRLIVDVPETVELNLVERNLDFPRRGYVRDGRRVYDWSTRDVPRLRFEPLAADSNGVAMSVGLAGPVSWERIGRWYAGLARDRYALTPAVHARVKEVVRGAGTRGDTVRAVHRWVAQDIRYLSIALGMGGYQPRTPDEVLRTGFGDCKDKATLFVAALDRLGIRAYPLLVHSTGGTERRLPSIAQFDHMIAAVENPDGSRTYTDLTADLTPYGSLPYGVQGEFALLVDRDGRSEELTLPLDPIESNHLVSRIVGTLLPDGTFDGRYEQVGHGLHQYGLREAFAQPMDREQHAAFLRNVANNVFTGASGADLVAFEGRDLAAEARVSLLVRGGRAARRSGETMILNLPFRGVGAFTNAAAEIEAHTPRRFPIDAESAFGPQTNLTELRLELPEGWTARLPESVELASPFGTFAAAYAQRGRELVVTQRFTGARGVLPPDRVHDLIAWYRAIGDADVPFIVLERAAR
jgi:hypothetical protein